MSATRSTAWTITNATDSDWTLLSSNLNHGVWATNPPQTIKSGATGTFTSESNGFATGDEGTVVYSFSAGSVSFYFDNPFIGSDDFSVNTPPGYDQKSNHQTGNTQVITSRVFKTA